MLVVDSVEQLVSQARWNGIKENADGLLWVTSKDSQLVFDLGALEWKSDLDYARLVVEFDISESDGSVIQRQMWLGEDKLLASRVSARQYLIKLQQDRLDEIEASRKKLASEVKELECRRELLDQTVWARIKRRLRVLLEVFIRP